MIFYLSEFYSFIYLFIYLLTYSFTYLFIIYLFYLFMRYLSEKYLPKIYHVLFSENVLYIMIYKYDSFDFKLYSLQKGKK